MKRIVIGILAHVDAGKTTLSEALLYACHIVRKLGRVDKKDSFLDNYALERERGITIYSKQAVFGYGDVSFTLLDTPGHVDFSPEMERTLCMLDAAVLVISGPEGVQAHTRTLWKLLKAYDVPTFVFVNKMDREVCLKGNIYQEIRDSLSKNCVDITSLFENGKPDSVYENIALCDEAVLDSYLETGTVSDEQVRELVGQRLMFPVLFGSALCLQGIEELLESLKRFVPPVYEEERFAARIYKVTRDDSGKRLTHMKITGGSLKNRDVVSYKKSREQEEVFEETGSGLISEKITEIRVYNGEKYESTDRAEQGMVVAVAGLSGTEAGGVLGAEEELPEKQLTPVLTYRVVGRDRSELSSILPRLRLMEEEEPQLHVIWNAEMHELQVRIMGEIQLEILKSRYFERFKENIEFDKGSILYRETVLAPVLGIGHYEPLRHYAEVQLVIEPGKPGSGIVFRSSCGVNELSTNWQRLIMTHVFEREHKGCLIGAVLDDVCITLVAGRDHLKHTEGGDFRQATYRAIRQGLMRALTEQKAGLLEPYYEFSLEVPRKCIGRAMSDIETRCGRITGQYETEYENRSGDAGEDMVLLMGVAPVSSMQGYVKEVTAYTKGLGTLYCNFHGYLPCHNQEEVVSQSGYDAAADMRNPSYSVFCAHGAGFPVEWSDVDSYKHIDCSIDLSGYENDGTWSVGHKLLTKGSDNPEDYEDLCDTGELRPLGPGAAGKYGGSNDGEGKSTDSAAKNVGGNGKFSYVDESFVTLDEIDSIMNRTFFSNRKEGYKNPFRKHKAQLALRENPKNVNSVKDGPNRTGASDNGAEKQQRRVSTNVVQKDRYLLVDGYNIIFAWDELKELAAVNIDAARDRLNDILCNFQAVHDYRLIVVYDAYRIAGHQTEYFTYRNICVVFTKEAEIADRYIEKFVHENAVKYDITVATSDGLEQIIIRGQGAKLWSARDLYDFVKENERRISEKLNENGSKIGTLIGTKLNATDNSEYARFDK